ncbi:cation diffusion facilitator family transporter [Hydromonas duriensis]|uniref:Cobalt-zinc-cadmium efflux system protein n=1 Tax=Hydromonas duriensis TaxID=1527608 RepID=A0A4R6Y9D9_9BURK|nr:cation diffusion facilitator family transporter [Hydromonas duriensis]TDR32048.1 cobalt-zinc-cadmium efflux system protein [Hydromonas duriensis]
MTNTFHNDDHGQFIAHGDGDANHNHQHHYNQAHYLGFALLLTGVFSLVEFFAGLHAQSLALISDAGHMLTDTAALALAYFAQKMVSRPASSKLSFGYTRVEIVAAFINGLTMAAIVLWIMGQALWRLWHPVIVNGSTVTWVATLGLVINLLVAWLLHRDQSSMNARAALLHVMGDLLGSVAAIAAGLVIAYTGWMPIDPILSIFVSLLIIRSTWALLKESVWHLMNAVPHHIDYNAVGHSLRELEGVASVHDLHIWDMSPNHPTLMAHVILESTVEWPILLNNARHMLLEQFGIEHVTLQPEWKLDDGSIPDDCASDED